MKREELQDLDLISQSKKYIDANVAGIIFLILGIVFSLILICASFLITEYEIIDRSDAIMYNGKFKKYIHDTQGRSDSYYVVLDDGSKFKLSMGADTQSARKEIKNIEKGQDLTILVHPNSKFVLSLSLDDNVIIDFDKTQENMQKETRNGNRSYFWMGLILLVSIVVYNLVSIIIKVTRRNFRQ